MHLPSSHDDGGSVVVTSPEIPEMPPPRRRGTPKHAVHDGPSAVEFGRVARMDGHKGASRHDVRKSFGFFDPFPLVRIWS